MTAMTGTKLSGAVESAASWPDRNIQNTLQQIFTKFDRVLQSFTDPGCNVGGVVKRPLEFVSLIHSPLGVCSCWLEALCMW